jgi:hypothetical protein
MNAVGTGDHWNGELFRNILEVQFFPGTGPYQAGAEMNHLRSLIFKALRPGYYFVRFAPAAPAAGIKPYQFHLIIGVKLAGSFPGSRETKISGALFAVFLAADYPHFSHKRILLKPELLSQLSGNSVQTIKLTLPQLLCPCFPGIKFYHTCQVKQNYVILTKIAPLPYRRKPVSSHLPSWIPDQVRDGQLVAQLAPSCIFILPGAGGKPE